MILENDVVIDTIVNATSASLQSTSVYTERIFLTFNFLVTSSTGQTAIIMFILVLLVEMLDITR